jgi:hypothetical protein
MLTKRQQYEEFVRKYENVYGSLPSGDKPVLFNVTGGYRNQYYKQEVPTQTLMFVLLMVGLLNVGGVSILYAVMVANLLTSLMFCATVAALIYNVSIMYGINEKKTVFDGEFIAIDGRLVGVVLPTQEDERRLEEANFRQTRDLNKLLIAFERAKVTSKNICVISVGSTTAQCIYGDTTNPEIDVGINSVDPAKIRELLDSVPSLGLDDVLVILNSAGYGVKEDAGIVVNDNVMECDTITSNIEERTVGGTGSNAAAMEFVRQVTKMHKSLDKNYVLAIVPRGDKAMPQGGSHSKQWILDLLNDDMNVIVLEVSGKQTKAFELVLDAAGLLLDTMDSEEICKKIKDVKIATSAGKTYGSDIVFRP